MLLRHVLIKSLRNIRIPGIVLQNAQHVRAVDIAEILALCCLYHDLDIVAEQRVAIGCLDLGRNVHVVLQPFYEDGAVCRGNEAGGIVSSGSMPSHIVDPFALVQLCCDEVPIAVVIKEEFHHGEVTLPVAEFLGEVKTVAVHMAVVYERIVEAAVGTLPYQHDVVAVPIVAADKAFIGVELRRIGDAHGAVGIAGIYHVRLGVHSKASVDLRKAVCCHGDGHAGRVIIGYGELSVAFVPDGDSVVCVASAAAEEFDFYIVFAVREAGLQRVHEGVIRQVGGFGGDARQGREDLVFHRVIGRRCSSMSETIGNGIGAAALAGVRKRFAHGLFQRRDASEVLGVYGDIVYPAFAAVIGIAAVHGRHRQGKEKRCGGFRDHFGHVRFNDKIQPERKVARGGVAVAVGQRHRCAAILAYEALQGVLHGDGVVCQRGFQTINEGIGAVEVHGAVI